MPLLSLIEDNFNFVRSVGIDAVNLSDGTPRNQQIILQEVAAMKYKLVYTTPERLEASMSLREVIDELYGQNLIERFVIDEVHCVSAWGSDFRPDYAKLSSLKERYPSVPLLGLTATASSDVKSDIQVKLGIKDKVIYF